MYPYKSPLSFVRVGYYDEAFNNTCICFDLEIQFIVTEQNFNFNQYKLLSIHLKKQFEDNNLHCYYICISENINCYFEICYIKKYFKTTLSVSVKEIENLLKFWYLCIQEKNKHLK